MSTFVNHSQRELPMLAEMRRPVDVPIEFVRACKDENDVPLEGGELPRGLFGRRRHRASVESRLCWEQVGVGR